MRRRTDAIRGRSRLNKENRRRPRFVAKPQAAHRPTGPRTGAGLPAAVQAAPKDCHIRIRVKSAATKTSKLGFSNDGRRLPRRLPNHPIACRDACFFGVSRASRSTGKCVSTASRRDSGTYFHRRSWRYKFSPKGVYINRRLDDIIALHADVDLLGGEALVEIASINVVASDGGGRPRGRARRDGVRVGAEVGRRGRGDTRLRPPLPGGPELARVGAVGVGERPPGAGEAGAERGRLLAAAGGVAGRRCRDRRRAAAVAGRRAPADAAGLLVGPVRPPRRGRRGVRATRPGATD